MAGPSALNRRDFLRNSMGGGFALGGLLGLGLDLRAAQEETRRFKFDYTREVPSVCPYCAVGCGQLVSVDKQTLQIVNIEGNPDSPVSRGTLCPKGAATFQLAVNPNRVTKVWYRAPGATEWDKTKTLEWAMDRVAQPVKKTRDETFQETWKAPDGTVKQVNNTLEFGMASLVLPIMVLLPRLDQIRRPWLIALFGPVNRPV